MRKVKCKNCGKEMEVRFGRKEYCNQCRQIRDRELYEKYKKEGKAK